MSQIIEKDKRLLLEDHGYVYIFERMIYINHSEKKIFSVEAIEDNRVDWLRENIERENTSNEWQFFFNAQPSDQVKQEILVRLGEC